MKNLLTFSVGLAAVVGGAWFILAPVAQRMMGVKEFVPRCQTCRGSGTADRTGGFVGEECPACHGSAAEVSDRPGQEAHVR